MEEKKNFEFEPTETINWAHDFGINEMLHSTAQKITSTYCRICHNNQNHPDYEAWDNLASEWADYDRKIRTFNFSTQEAGEAEVDRIAEIYKHASGIEKTLMKK